MRRGVPGLALLLVLLAACGESDRGAGPVVPAVLPAAPATGAPPRLVLALSLTGLRHDDLQDPSLAPNLHALRLRSLSYEDHTAASLGRNAALCSAWTGLAPLGGIDPDGAPRAGHGVGSLASPRGGRLAPGVTTLAERAHEAGRTTLAAVASPQLHDDLSGLAQGFDVYQGPPPEPDLDLPAESVLALVRSDLRVALERGASVLAWVELCDLERVPDPDPALARARLRVRLAPLAERVPAALEALERASLSDAEALDQVRALLGRARGSEAHTALHRGLREARLVQLDRELGAFLEELRQATGGDLGVVLWSPRGALWTPPATSTGPAFPPAMVRTPLWVSAPGLVAGRIEGCLTSCAVHDALGALLGLVPGLPDPDPDDRVRLGDARLEHMALLDRAGQVEGHVCATPAAFDREGTRVVLQPSPAQGADPWADLRALVEAWQQDRPPTGLRLRVGAPDGGELRWKVLAGLPGPASLEPLREGDAVGVQGLGGRAVCSGPAEVLLGGSRVAQGMRFEWVAAGDPGSGGGPWSQGVPCLRHDGAAYGAEPPAPGEAPVELRVEGGWVRLQVNGAPARVRGELYLFPPLGADPAPLEWGGDPSLEVVPVLGRDDALAFSGSAPTTLSLRLPPRCEPALWLTLDGQAVPPWAMDADGAPMGSPEAQRYLLPEGLEPGPAAPDAVLAVERRDPPLAGGPPGAYDRTLRTFVRRLPASE